MLAVVNFRRNAALPLMAVAVVIVLLTWHQLSLMPGPGIDKSWQAGLSIAAHDSLGFGDRSIFTYGPLGFLANPQLWYTNLAIAAVVYQAAVRLAVAAAVFLGARRTFGPLGAFLVALLVVAAAQHFPESPIVLIALVWALTRPMRDRVLVAVAAAAGAFAAVEILLKVSVGVTVAVLVAAWVVALPERRLRAALAACGGLLAAGLGCWLAMGLDPGTLPLYVERSAQAAAGFSQAMQLEAPQLGWQWPAAAACFLVGIWGVLQSTELDRPRARLGAGLMWLAFCFFAFKEGFVRHEQIHGASFFQTIAP